MQPIAEALARVTLGAPAQFQNLTVFPLQPGQAGALFAINGRIATHSLRPSGRRAGDEGAY